MKIKKLNEAKSIKENIDYVRWVQLPDGQWKMWGSNPGPELDAGFLDRARKQNNIEYKDVKVAKNGEYPEGVDEKDIYDKHRFDKVESISEDIIPIEVVPDTRKWQYSVGGKDVPYTSYEDAKAHLKDDYNIIDYREELQQYINTQGAHFTVDETFDDRLVISINWGDWKHDHAYADYLVRKFFMDKGLGIETECETTEEDGSDTYSAEHYYDINDINLSGRVVEESKSIKTLGAKAKKLNESDALMPDDDEYERIDRSGTEGERLVAAVSYMYGVDMNTAKEYINDLGDTQRKKALAYYDLRDLPRDVRLAKIKELYPRVRESINPADLTDCPQCGDISFDSKRGRCTKCSYREALQESVTGKYGKVSYEKRADGLSGDTAHYAGYHLFSNDGRYTPYWAGETAMGSSYASIEDAVKGIDSYVDKQKAAGKMKFLRPVAESNDVQYGVHQFSTDSIIFRGTEQECGEYIDKNKKLWDDAEVYRMKPGDPHYKKVNEAVEFDSQKYVGKEAAFDTRNDDWTDSEGIIEYDGQSARIKGCAVDNDSFRDSYWDIVFDDGAEFGAVSGYNLTLNKAVNEASYGGAFDIEDDQYFTRDDLNSFAEEVLGHVAETFNGVYDIGGVWFEDGNVITQIVDDSGNEYEDTTKVDMRKIREPWHLKRMYAFPVAAKIIQQIEDNDADVITENVRGMGEYSDKFYDFASYLEQNDMDGDAWYLISQLIRYCKEEDLKDLWIDRMRSIANKTGFGVESDDYIDESKKLDENVEEEAATAQRYLDVEIPDACRTLVDVIPSMPENILLSVNNRLRKFYNIMTYYINGYGPKNESLTEDDSTTKNVAVAFDVTVPVNMSEDAIEHELRRNLRNTDLEISSYVEVHTLNESLEEDVEVPVLSGPVEGPESGLAALLNEALQDELKTIQMYNDTAVTARAEGFEDIALQIDEINTEENKHVGQLQELLKTISPNAQAIDAGELEAGDDLVSVQENINNSDDSGNNNNEGDVIMEGKERWEEIYDSFKTIEKELNGDGEAITATIDKLYTDNVEDPDYKKAYDKWASNE